MPAGLGKKVGKCWKKHKKAIIIGAVITAIVVTAVVVTVCSGGTAGGAAAVVGSAAVSSLQNSLEEDRESERPPSTQIFPQPTPSISLPQEIDFSLPPTPPAKPVFLDDGIILNDRYVTYWEIHQYHHQEELFSSILQSSPLPQPADRPIFHENGISWKGREFTYEQWLQQT